MTSIILTINYIIIDHIIRYQKKVYPKDSFDRFGDDLTELILSFLWFEDKIRLECVSKQWKRCVFQRQFVIQIGSECSDYLNFIINELSVDIKFDVFSLKIFNENYQKYKKRFISIDKTSLETLVKKCPNITTVRVYSRVKTEVLSLFGQYCPNIKSLIFSSNITYNHNYLSFFRENGHKLREVIVVGTDEVIKPYLRLCPNLNSVSISPTIITEDKEFLPNLRHIMSSDLFWISAKEIKILSDKYCQTLKTLELKIRFDDMDDKEVKTFGQNFRFNDLRKLCLALNFLGSGQLIEECLSMIGHNCPKLTDLTIISLSISTNTLTIFSKFKALKKLNLVFMTGNKVENMENFESFKHCPHLKELFIYYMELREDVFTNIQSSLPKLQSLRIRTEEKFSDSFINSFHSMKFMQKIILFNQNNQITESIGISINVCQK